MVVTLVSLASTFAFKSGFEAQARPRRRRECSTRRFSDDGLDAADARGCGAPQAELAEREKKVFNSKKKLGSKK